VSKRSRSHRTHGAAGLARWRLVVSWCLATVGLGAGGCTHRVEQAESAYRDGRYLEAAEDLAEQEGQLEQLSLSDRAQYGLYRGLSLLKLGEIDGAQHWLQYSADVERTAPGSLAPYQRLQLDQGMMMLRQLSGQPGTDGLTDVDRLPLEPGGGG
jgi:hypothetical protein